MGMMLTEEMEKAGGQRFRSYLAVPDSREIAQKAKIRENRRGERHFTDFPSFSFSIKYPQKIV